MANRVSQFTLSSRSSRQCSCSTIARSGVARTYSSSSRSAFGTEAASTLRSSVASMSQISFVKTGANVCSTGSSESWRRCAKSSRRPRCTGLHHRHPVARHQLSMLRRSRRSHTARQTWWVVATVSRVTGKRLRRLPSLSSASRSFQRARRTNETACRTPICPPSRNVLRYHKPSCDAHICSSATLDATILCCSTVVRYIIPLGS